MMLGMVVAVSWVSASMVFLTGKKLNWSLFCHIAFVWRHDLFHCFAQAWGETDWSAFAWLGRVRHFRNLNDVRLLPLRWDEAFSRACIEEVCHYLSQVKSVFFQNSVVQFVRSRHLVASNVHSVSMVISGVMLRPMSFVVNGSLNSLRSGCSPPPQTPWNFLLSRFGAD